MIRMLFCIAIGFLLLALQGDVSLLRVDLATLGIAALSGVATSVFVVSWLVSVKRGAYMMLDVFMTLGTIIPIMACSFLYKEAIELNQIIGLVILVVAVLIMCSYNNSVKEKMKFSSFLILVLCGVTNGIADFSQKLFVKTNSAATVEVFNFYTYVFAGLFLLACYMVSVKKLDKENLSYAAGKIKSVFFYIIIMSVCLFLHSYFKLLAANTLSAAQLYPLSQGLGMIVSTIMSAVFFKEKLNAKCIIGIVIAFVGLIFINVL
jgi:drug/metabolite transporter (DMT)-like permease